MTTEDYSLSDQNSRRDFLQFMGVSTATLATTLGTGFTLVDTALAKSSIRLSSVGPLKFDKVSLVRGLQYKTLISWKDKINKSGDSFGTNCDFLSTIKTKEHGRILFVNHEAPHPLFVSKFNGKHNKTKNQVDLEKYSVGNSVLSIVHDKKTGWKVDINSPLNRRLTADTKIPYANNGTIDGSKISVGTFANCAGGKTPWNTFLTCEENYQDYYGDIKHISPGKEERTKNNYYRWGDVEDRNPKHYGWVVEVNPLKAEAKKHIALGRFAHEGAAVGRAKNGKIVVYMGDDKADECFYKFISDSKDSLDKGILYVANIEKGRWIPVDYNHSPILKKHFKNPKEVLIHCRKAAKIVGGTPLARPEGSAIQPKTNNIFLCLTNNAAKNDHFGQIAKFEEQRGDHGALKFTHSTFLTGGDYGLFACPDNIAFDRAGNLWFTSDISGGKLNKPPYKGYGNNGLFYVPLTKRGVSNVYKIASAPNEAEFTGPTFADDENTLFLSVQHPGEKTKDLKNPTSSWNAGKDGIPRSSVIAITGPLMDQLLNS